MTPAALSAKKPRPEEPGPSEEKDTALFRLDLDGETGVESDPGRGLWRDALSKPVFDLSRGTLSSPRLLLARRRRAVTDAEL